MVLVQTSTSNTFDSVATTIDYINSTFGFSIPRHGAGHLHPTYASDEEKCHQGIKQLFYTDRDGLRQICTDWEARLNEVVLIRSFLLSLKARSLHVKAQKARRVCDGPNEVAHPQNDATGTDLTGKLTELAKEGAESAPVNERARHVKKEPELAVDRPQNIVFQFGTKSEQNGFSFTSVVTSVTGASFSPFSSQSTQPDTANTSFNFSFRKDEEVPANFLRAVSEQLQPHNFDFSSRGRGQIEEKPDDGHGSDTESDDDIGSNFEPYQLRNFPDSFLFVDDNHKSLNKLSQRMRYECTRIALNADLPVEFVASQVQPDAADYDEVWKLISNVAAHDLPAGVAPSKQNRAREPPPRLSSNAWNAASSRDLRLSGSLQFNESRLSKKLFSFELHPCEPEATSNRFFRKFGAHRFLRVDIPLSKNLPKHLKDKEGLYRQRLLQWMNKRDRSFLDRTWSVFYFHENRKNKKRMVIPRTATNKSTYRAFLFATSGCGLRYISIRELWEWFMPHALNSDLKFLKAYSRLQLGFSGTQASLKFKPSQIGFVSDTRSDGAHDPGTFNDPLLDWSVKPKAGQIMNDGCSRVSFKAALKVWESLGKPEPMVPSVFQARIGPAKGVWIVELPDVRSAHCPDPEVWIELSESQVKFKCHDDDLDSQRYDVERLTFEVVGWSRKAEPATLHLDFVHIMHDRGVPKDCLANAVRQVFQAEGEELLNSLSVPADLYAWLQSKVSIGMTSKGITRWIGDFPDMPSDQMGKLLESGFTAQTNKYLAELLYYVLRSYLQRLNTSMKAPVPLSTMLIGVADPYGCLAPDEIHLLFSTPFVDPATGQCFQYLDDLNALVTRFPALRNSDVQKVKCVFKKELAHIRDVAVFPSTGQYPLAGKLQGGDYDGDTFWVCWDKAIVLPFKNAPAPLSTLVPDEHGIKVNREILSSFNKSSDPLSKILGESFRFHLKKNMLGVCTNRLEELIYAKVPVSRKVIEEVTNLHDLLVDSPKNGYEFDQESWKAFGLRLGLNKIPEIQPLYKKNKKTNGKTQDLVESGHEIINEHSIGDYLVFEIASQASKIALKELENRSSSVPTHDEDVSHFYANLIKTVNGADVATKYSSDTRTALLQASHKLREDFKHLYALYNHHRTNEALEDRVRRAKKLVRSNYESIGEGYLPDDLLREWTRVPARYAPSLWDCFKASVLFDSQHSRPSFCFWLAGSTICYLKSHSLEGSNTIASTILTRLKVKKSKKTEQGRGLGQDVLLKSFDSWKDDAQPQIVNHDYTTAGAQESHAVMDLTQQLHSSGIAA